MRKVRDTARVTPLSAVDGTKKRKKPSVGGRNGRVVSLVQVNPLVMAAAKKALREGEKIQIVDGDTVLIVKGKEA